MILGGPFGLSRSPFHLDVAHNPMTTWSEILSHRFGVPFGLSRKLSYHMVQDLESQLTLVCRGDFGGEPRGSTLKSNFPF